MTHTGPPPKTCATCGRRIGAREVYYRFKLILQGEQDVLDAGGGGGEDELAALVRQLEAGPEDPRALEEQVHWERAGCVCSQCRSMAVRLLSSPPPPVGPH
jgi:hypothetical protein